MRRCLLFLPAALVLALPALPADPAADNTDDADEATLVAAKVGVDPPALLAFLRKRTLDESGRQRLAIWIRQLGSPSYPSREAASHELAALGVPARAALRAVLADPDLEIARRARACLDQIDRGPGSALPATVVRQLSRKLRGPSAEAIDVLLAFFPYADDDIVEEETLAALVTFAARTEAGQRPEAALLTGLRDPLPARRGAAAYVLGRRSEPNSAAEVRKLLTDRDSRVRLRAAQGLLLAHDAAAVLPLIELVGEGHPDLAWQAEDLLYRLAGEQPPDLPADDGSDGNRAKRRDGWLAWWRDKGKQVDLNVLTQEAQPLGLTVIAQMDGQRVWECGRDGQVRWEITGLQGPIDAQILPGGRVLIAEYQGQHVSERDLRGNILWRQRIDGNPTGAVRLRNGNTFVATYRHVMEFTRDGKIAYHHQLDGGGANFYAAQKLANGRIIAVSSQGRLIEVDASTGRTLKAFQALKQMQGSPYSVEALPGGRYLLANYGQNEVVEVDGSGQIVWRFELQGAYHATRLPNGNTLASSHGGKRVVEVSRDGKIVWETPTRGHVWRVHRR